MNPYMFVIDAIPAPTNKDCEDIAGARVHVWVISKDKENAKLQAMDYITSYLWTITNIEYELEIQHEQILDLGEDETQLYRKACQFGIAADFLAYPKIPKDRNDPVIKKKLRRDL
ncbi:hypothetical protein NST28_11825 [Paenibacillus sp. FSL R10-2791]|uniref:hypothetical protein n=1 Tax=Paenibacillus TaxID=44249 RepID=UPI0004F7515A|nr:hypothetical protein [Paenibacillus odorifer]AIQ73907.1 hypothetical protein PODO_12015 [Paenibacillus odorifer]